MLAHDPVLWQALSNAFAGKRWTGTLDAMLADGGYRLRFPVRVRGKRPGADRIVWVGLTVSPPRSPTTRPCWHGADTLMIIQDYGYGQTSRATTTSGSVGGGVGGDGGAFTALGQTGGGNASLSTGHGRGGSGGLSSTATRLDGTATFQGADRVRQSLAITITVSGAGRGIGTDTVVALGGSLIREIPDGLSIRDDGRGDPVDHDRGAPADPRPFTLPETFSVETMRADDLAATILAGLSDRRMMGARRAGRFAADLEHALTPNALQAFLRRMVTPDGHVLLRLPIRGRTAVDVVVRVVPAGGRTVVGGRDVELRSVNRQEEKHTAGVTDSRTLPLSRSGGANHDLTGTSMGVTNGAQAGHQLGDVGGKRSERTLYLQGEGATIALDIAFEITLQRGTVRRDGTLHVARELIVRDDGYGYVTLFESDLAHARAQQETVRAIGGGWQLGTGAARTAVAPIVPWETGRVLRVDVGALAAAAAGRDRFSHDPHGAMAEVLTIMLTRTRAGGVVVVDSAARNRRYSALTHVRLLARRLGLPITAEITVAGAGGRQMRRYRVGPDGSLEGLRDGGFAAALASLPPEMLAQADRPDGIDLHAIFRRYGPADFADQVRNELRRRGIIAVAAPDWPVPTWGHGVAPGLTATGQIGFGGIGGIGTLVVGGLDHALRAPVRVALERLLLGADRTRGPPIVVGETEFAAALRGVGIPADVAEDLAARAFGFSLTDPATGAGVIVVLAGKAAVHDEVIAHEQRHLDGWFDARDEHVHTDDVNRIAELLRRRTAPAPRGVGGRAALTAVLSTALLLGDAPATQAAPQVLAAAPPTAFDLLGQVGGGLGILVGTVAALVVTRGLRRVVGRWSGRLRAGVFGVATAAGGTLWAVLGGGGVPAIVAAGVGAFTATAAVVPKRVLTPIRPRAPTWLPRALRGIATHWPVRLTYEVRLYTPVVQVVAMLAVAWLFGPAAAVLVGAYLSLFPHGKLWPRNPDRLVEWAGAVAATLPIASTASFPVAVTPVGVLSMRGSIDLLLGQVVE